MWLGGFITVVVCIVYFDEIRTVLGIRLTPEDFGLHATNAPSRKADETPGDKTVTIAANQAGHYETKVNINGRSVHVMVDTGATMVALSHEDAAAAGIHPSRSDFTQRVSTANGFSRVAPVMLDEVSIHDITVRDVRAVVAEPGRLQTSLLGMSFLSQLKKTEISRGVLTLQD